MSDDIMRSGTVFLVVSLFAQAVIIWAAIKQDGVWLPCAIALCNLVTWLASSSCMRRIIRGARS